MKSKIFVSNPIIPWLMSFSVGYALYWAVPWGFEKRLESGNPFAFLPILVIVGIAIGFFMAPLDVNGENEK